MSVFDNSLLKTIASSETAFIDEQLRWVIKASWIKALQGPVFTWTKKNIFKQSHLYNRLKNTSGVYENVVPKN